MSEFGGGLGPYRPPYSSLLSPSQSIEEEKRKKVLLFSLPLFKRVTGEIC